MMLEPLMESVLDDPYSMYCLLCETVEYPESRDWIIFNLRPEARFSDGSSLTADDVLFTFELLRDKGFPSYSEALKTRVASATVLDTHRIRFDFMPDIERRDVLG